MRLRDFSFSLLDRRRFLASALTAGVARGEQQRRIRFAYSGFVWQNEIEEGIRTTARFGFHGIEPFRQHILPYLERPLALKDRLDEAGIVLSTCSNGGPMQINFIDPRVVSETVADHFAFARDFLRPLGCGHFKINLGRRPEGGTSGEQLRTMARTLNELGKRTADLGIRLAPHPHIWGALEREHEVERVLDSTDAEFVSIVADTAHLTLGGMDPLRIIRDYYPRVAALHFKDTEAKYRGHTGPTPSRELHRKVNLYKNLGTGGVDFPAIYRMLTRRGFEGWITLDFDPPRPGAGTIDENIAANKRYLEQTLGVEF